MLVSDLVTGSVVVGTRPTLPLKWYLILKVVANPNFTSKLITLVSTEKLEEVFLVF